MDLLFEGMWLINPTPVAKEKRKCCISSVLVLETAAVLWELNTLLFLTYSSNPVSHRSSEQMLTQKIGPWRGVFFFFFLNTEIESCQKKGNICLYFHRDSGDQITTFLKLLVE